VNFRRDSTVACDWLRLGVSCVSPSSMFGSEICVQYSSVNEAGTGHSSPRHFLFISTVPHIFFQSLPILQTTHPSTRGCGGLSLCHAL